MGRVIADTHIADADLNFSVEKLNRNDWVSFREVSIFSQQVVKETIEKIGKWYFDYRQFYYAGAIGSKDWLDKTTIAPINAGEDLILFAYGKELYYEVIYYLLKAEKG